MTRPMATEAATTYFGVDHADQLMITEMFRAPTGWQPCTEPYEYLSPAMVQELDRAGMTGVRLSTHRGRHADFTVIAGGPISPAYLA